VVILHNERAETRASPSIIQGQTLELSVSVDLTKIRKRVLIQVTGMSCASCVAKIERYLVKKKGEEFTTHIMTLLIQQVRKLDHLFS